MDQFIQSLPKTVVALGALVLGFLFMVLNDPPKTTCDAQLELFRESQKKFLYSKIHTEKDAVVLTINELFESCRHENNPGGCFELFQGLKKLAEDLKNIPPDCSSQVASESELEQWLFKSLRLMVQMAWGDRAPAAFTQKHGWYDSSDLALYCSLNRSARSFFGDQAHQEWRESVLRDLPQAAQLNRETLWQKSILSTPCDLYR